MELEKGMYVRVEKYDRKNKKYITEIVILDDFKFEYYKIYKNFIIKPSHNIIDLIEVGDYVNGELVYEKCENDLYNLIGEKFKKLKTIVTKEQFKNMEFEVG